MNILGYIYTLKRDIAVNNSNASALCDSTKLEICLPLEQQPKQIEQSAILHEIIEALNAHLELSLPHPVIASLEAGLFQTLTSNGVDLSPLSRAIEVPEVKTWGLQRLAAKVRHGRRA